MTLPLWQIADGLGLFHAISQRDPIVPEGLPTDGSFNDTAKRASGNQLANTGNFGAAAASWRAIGTCNVSQLEEVACGTA